MNLLLQIIALGVGVNLYGLLAEKVLDGINNLLHWAAFPGTLTIRDLTARLSAPTDQPLDPVQSLTEFVENTAKRPTANWRRPVGLWDEPDDELIAERAAAGAAHLSR